MGRGPEGRDRRPRSRAARAGDGARTAQPRRSVLSAAPTAPDVVVVGAGIVGVSCAAFLAEAGTSVTVVDREGVAAGASGRNSGALEHPYDAATVALFEHTVELLGIAAEPIGALLLATGEHAALALAAHYGERFPELEPSVLDPRTLREREPGVASDRGDELWACLLATGWPVAPAGATEALWARARAAGAQLRLGPPARLLADGRRAQGVVLDGESLAAGAVVVAAGAASGQLLAPDDPFVWPIWGVNLEIDLGPRSPRSLLLEAALVEQQLAPGGAGPVEAFGLIPHGPRAVLGSTFWPQEPVALAAAARLLRERAGRFYPAAAAAPEVSLRACARPRSADGRPLLGLLPPYENVYLATGHGGRGISTGPASGRMVAELLLGARTAVPPELDAARLVRG